MIALRLVLAPPLSCLLAPPQVCPRRQSWGLAPAGQAHRLLVLPTWGSPGVHPRRQLQVGSSGPKQEAMLVLRPQGASPLSIPRVRLARQLVPTGRRRTGFLALRLVLTARGAR